MKPLLLLLCIHVASAQNPTQTIRGIVRDKTSKQLLIGAKRVQILRSRCKATNAWMYTLPTASTSRNWPVM